MYNLTIGANIIYNSKAIIAFLHNQSHPDVDASVLRMHKYTRIC